MLTSAAYPPLDSLFDLACRDGVDIRPTLLRVLTDLYVQKKSHSTEEETQYVELALGLIDSVDAPTRAVVTARLEGYPATPAVVLSRLRGETAMPPPAPASSGRAHSMDKRDDDLASLFFMAGADERRMILTNLDVTVERTAYPPAPASYEAIRRLEAAALTRNTSEFVRLLQRSLGVHREMAERIVRDGSGEPIVVAAKALGMGADVLQRILLFLNPVVGQSVERVHDLARLYDELTLGAAARMLAIWRSDASPSRPAHTSLHWDDEPRRARAGEHRARGRRTLPHRANGAERIRATVVLVTPRHSRGNGGQRDPRPRSPRGPDRI
jgi:hypothetical protein